jgi:ribosomal protein S18 acetylase RimI-like enzyme
MGRYGSLLVKLHHGFDAERFIGATEMTPSKYAGYLASQIGRDDVIVLVAELGGVVSGYLYGAVEGPDYMALRGPAGALYDLFIDPATRSRGVGGRLFDAGIAALRELGCKRIVLSTAYKNEEAHRLFLSRGFRPTMIEMTREIG